MKMTNGVTICYFNLQTREHCSRFLIIRTAWKTAMTRLALSNLYVTAFVDCFLAYFIY